jgi:methyl-accepting chemotaxis protein
MKSWTLGFKLVCGGILIVAVPLIVAGVISAVKSSNALEEAARVQMVSTAQHLADNVKSLLNEELKIAANLSIDHEIVEAAANVAKNGKAAAAADVATLDKRLTAFLAKMGGDYEAIFIADAEGVIYADGNGGGYKGLPIGQRAYFGIARGGKASIGDIVKSRVTGLPVAIVCAPIVSGPGGFAGVVVFVIKVGFVADRVTALRIGQTGYAMMIDKTGLFIAHPKKELVMAVNTNQQEGLKEIGAKMTSLRTGYEFFTFGGFRKMAGYAPVETTGWSIAVVQNVDEMLAESHALRNYIVLTGLIFLALTVPLVLLFSRSISGPIRRIADRLNNVSAELASSSTQVASASQNLAEGASEQASSLEEMSSSMEEMSSMTRRNADNAKEAKSMMDEAENIVTDVDRHMNSLAKAMTAVAASSEETAKILKTIDEIAFQTNLLALNAAVEAARAGEAGAGFAVVAEEVRNLALRASEAAKNTSTLIENTMDDVRNGTRLTDATKESFRRNMDITMKMGSLIDEIAAASDEQVRGIEQVARAVVEMDKVTQETAANAEESASASEEMNAQAVAMREAVRDLAGVIGGGHGDAPVHDGDAAPSMPAAARRLPALPPSAAETGARPAAKTRGRAGATKPEQVIPFDEGEFKDF